MKKTIRNFGSAALLGMMLITANTTLRAQSEESTTTTSTTTTAGTVSEFGPKTIVIRTEKSPEPVRYSYTKTTTYVDEAGNPVSMATVKSGLPVTVYYTRAGDQMVASKVIVRKTTVVAPSTEVAPAPPIVEEKKTTTTTTTDSDK